jgi:hypothetical protein
MPYIASFFNSPKNTYGLHTIPTENSLAPIYEYFVMSTELMDLYTGLGGNIVTKKVDSGWIAVITSYKDILRTVSYPSISFITFVGRNEEQIKDEAISWFKRNKLDICNLNDWLVKE